MDAIGKNWKIYILFALSVLLSLVYLFFGIGLVRDQFYWIHLIQNPSSSPMTIGTLWIGKIWSYIFSDSILSLRILRYSIDALSLFLIYKALPGRSNLSLVLISIAIFLMGFGLQNEFSPTVLSNFSIICLILAFKRYIAIHKLTLMNLWKPTFLISLITSFAVLIRFPNISAIPIVVLLIICNAYARKQHITSTICVCCSFIVLSITIYWIYLAILLHTIHPFSQLYNSIIVANTGTHSIHALFNGYLWDFKAFFGYFCSAFFFANSLILFRKYLNMAPLKIKILISFSFAFIFSLFFIKCIGFHKWHNVQLLYFLSATVIVYCLTGIIKNINAGYYLKTLFFISILLLPFVSTTGSDTRYLKLFPTLVILSPLVVSQIGKTCKNDLFALPVLVILILATIKCFCGNQSSLNGKDAIWACKSHNKCRYTSGILIRQDDSESINSILNDCKEYAYNNKLVFGDLAFFISVITENEIQLGTSSFGGDLDDPNYVNEGLAKIINHDCNTIFLCNNKTGNLFEQELIKLGYIKSKENNIYVIYTRNNI